MTNENIIAAEKLWHVDKQGKGEWITLTVFQPTQNEDNTWSCLAVIPEIFAFSKLTPSTSDAPIHAMMLALRLMHYLLSVDIKRGSKLLLNPDDDEEITPDIIFGPYFSGSSTQE
jgi:hypothetical protein